ncbi:MAG TPA: endonuclease domain-containing protein [Methylomirabilota bacterium]|nr:endonuclease domain-containing protein [Methylomirabilota bacterium]
MVDEHKGWARPPGSTVRVSTARRLRASMTPQEVKVWNWLRERLHPIGWKFRRQARIGRFIVDFASLRPKVVIEIDGDSHGTETGLQSDIERDGYLRGEGFVVIRINNSEVGMGGDAFMDLINARLNVPTPQETAP